MKKISLILTVIFVFSLCACSGKTPPAEETASQSETEATSETDAKPAFSFDKDAAEAGATVKTSSSPTWDFFDDDVIFEDTFLPVKETVYFSLYYDELNGTEKEVTVFEYDVAGNLIKKVVLKTR